MLSNYTTQNQTFMLLHEKYKNINIDIIDQLSYQRTKTCDKKQFHTFLQKLS